MVLIKNSGGGRGIFKLENPLFDEIAKEDSDLLGASWLRHCLKRTKTNVKYMHGLFENWKDY